MTEHLDVFLHGDLIGVITPTRRDRRQVTFAIESTYAIGGEFNHHRVTLDHFRAEVASWGGLSSRRADSIIADTLSRFGAALEETPSVPGGSPALRDRLGYNLDRISSGRAIGKPKKPLVAWPKGN